jgi:integrase
MNRRTIIEIFGLLSVIGSLIFVGVEISQNTQAVRGATHQSVSDQISEYYLTIAADERLADLVARALRDEINRQDLNRADQLSVDLVIVTGIRRVENIYLQYKNGILEKDAFERIGYGSYRGSFARLTWNDWKGEFDKGFITFFENSRDGITN